MSPSRSSTTTTKKPPGRRLPSRKSEPYCRGLAKAGEGLFQFRQPALEGEVPVRPPGEPLEGVVQSQPAEVPAERPPVQSELRLGLMGVEIGPPQRLLLACLPPPGGKAH